MMGERDKDALEETIPVPQKEDILFGPSSDWQANACVNGLDDSMAYVDGYRRGAQILAQQVCTTGREQDFLVYPIVYLYRHHVELVLKSLARTATSIVDHTLSRADEDILGRHDLLKIWLFLKPLLNPVSNLGGSPDFNEEEIAGVDSYIEQLHKHDPDGQRFRYSLTKGRASKEKSTRSMHPDLSHINIRNFAEKMETLSDFLDNLDYWFDSILDAKREFEASNYDWL